MQNLAMRYAPTDVAIPVHGSDKSLPGMLMVPPRAFGLVIFVHGSGSGRLTPRNGKTAAGLTDSGLATLLFDLLTEDERCDETVRPDPVMLARRVGDAISWAKSQPECSWLEIGLFGSDTGAAAAIIAAADHPGDVSVLVSRSGRPELAGGRVAGLRAPCLMIVGENDDAVVDFNRLAQKQMICPSELAVVRGASHLFEEPGALDATIRRSADWFVGNFGSGRRAERA
ncbi:MAG: hypothetical protein P8X43_02235 [Maritimibacter sp.]